MAFIYLIWNRTRSTIKAKKKHANKVTYIHNKGMQIVTRAERKLRYKQNMLPQYNQFQSSKCATIHVRVIKLFSVHINTIT